MQRSTTRIRTSHVGRLPPPKGWEDMPGRLASAEITDAAVIAAQVTPAIAETVKRQVETGIDCRGDSPGSKRACPKAHTPNCGEPGRFRGRRFHGFQISYQLLFRPTLTASVRTGVMQKK